MNNVPQNRKRILLDISIASSVSDQTGIQRVVRNICRESKSVADELDSICIPVVCHGQQLVAVGFDGRRRWDERFFASIRNGWMSAHRGIAKCVSLLKSGADQTYLHFLSRLRKLFLPKTPLRWLGNQYYRLTGQQIKFREGDVLVLLDASWNLPIEDLLTSASNSGVGIATVIYDLIPINHPQFHQESLRRIFASWLKIVTDRSDFFIGISETVSKELTAFASQRNDRLDSKSFDHFRLGADFSSSTSELQGKMNTHDCDRAQLGIARKLQIKQNQLQNFYLAVGTIEPRKNHRLLLDAFDEHWNRHPAAQLLIAGKVGWMCEELVERIKSHPQFGISLFLLEDGSDNELSWLYQNGRALIFPSFVEGFGLPIVEALQNGLPVIASDTPIHREVGMNHCVYFDVSSPEDLVNILSDVEESRSVLNPPSDYQSTSWRESCQELLTKIVNYFDQKDAAASDHRINADETHQRSAA